MSKTNSDVQESVILKLLRDEEKELQDLNEKISDIGERILPVLKQKVEEAEPVPENKVVDESSSAVVCDINSKINYIRTLKRKISDILLSCEV